ncbi:NUDIX hydrolase [Glycomyces paridis]|uniref:NUDIX domain-containing protein n=1 Tax=Glycomyces paridis TaxID=2126555 RepID=A0A4V4HNH3_9ACTN|nr:NUDIX domain-containing protein [Glycomyces paridis]THV26036.1 NUDIX domain-containing protein [Glycomyces paridis]
MEADRNAPQHADLADLEAAVGLARLAGMLRAEAANGLYWGAEPEEGARLRRLRVHAAALMAEVDHRSSAEILAIFEGDTVLRTPLPGTEFRIVCGDGTRIVHRKRLGERTLGSRVAAVAAALGAEVPEGPFAIADTDLCNLPCPHTYLLVYEFATALDGGAVTALLEPGDPDLEGYLLELAPEASAVRLERKPLRVSAAVREILAEVAALAAEALETVDSPYGLERRERISALCEHTEAAEVAYPRIDCGDLAAPCVSTGADAAVFDDEGRLLVIRRTDTGQWAVPGGMAEVGEPVGMSAVREAAEETGLDVELTSLSWAFDKRDTNLGDSRAPMIMSFTARRIDVDQPIRLAELEASDHRWVTREEAAELDLFRGHELRVPAAFARHVPRGWPKRPLG